MASTRIPADVGLLLRGGLYVGIARVTADISDECSLEDPGDLAGLLVHFDRTRALLDHIGWEKKPQQHHDLEVDDAHRQALIETLEEDRESWDWLSHQETTESAEGRKRAAAKAKTIKRFLARVTPTALVNRTEALGHESRHHDEAILLSKAPGRRISQGREVDTTTTQPKSS